MKKLLALLLALALCASLIACGGGDNDGDDSYDPGDSNADAAGGPTDEQLSALTEAYQQVSAVYNDAAIKVNESAWSADAQTVEELNTLGTMLEPIGLALSGDMSYLEGADFDELPAALLEMLPTAQALLEKVSQPYDAGDSTVITDEALKPVANAYNEAASAYNEVYTTAEANGWLNDEQTAAELDAAYAVITFTGSGLSDDPSKLENADLEELATKLQEFVPELEKIGERVSVPYGDVG